MSVYACELPRGDESLWLIGVASRRCRLSVALACLCRARRAEERRQEAERRSEKERNSGRRPVRGRRGNRPARAERPRPRRGSHEDFLKATGNKQYIPFTVTFDPVEGHGPDGVACTGGSSPRTRLPPRQLTAPAGKDEKKDDKKAPAPRFAYEDLNTIPVTAGQTGPAKISRAFTVDWRDLRRLRRGQGSRPRSRRTPRRRRCR